jgi:regulatory protein
LATELGINQFLTDQEIQGLKSKETEYKLYQSAVRLLSVRPRSEAELRRSFQKKKAPLDLQDKVITRLIEEGLIDDWVFAETWVENRLAFRPRGKRALKAELLQKGVSRQITAEAIESIDEEAAAVKAAEKASRRFIGLSYQDYKRKLFGYLSRRGFPYDLIYQMIDRFWDERMDHDLESEETK